MLSVSTEIGLQLDDNLVLRKQGGYGAQGGQQSLSGARTVGSVDGSSVVSRQQKQTLNNRKRAFRRQVRDPTFRLFGAATGGFRWTGKLVYRKGCRNADI